MRVRCSAALRKAAWRRRISLPTRIYWGSGRNAIFLRGPPFSFSNKDTKVQDYRRDLDLSSGVATVKYSAGKAQYERTVFCSAPDRVLVLRLTAKNGAMNGTVTFGCQLQHRVWCEEGRLILSGICPEVCYPNYCKYVDDVRYGTFEETKAIRFEGRVAAYGKRGFLRGSRNRVKKLWECTLLVSLATSFQGL